MSKKLLLALGAITLMGGSLTLASSTQSPTIVSAEGETSVVEVESSEEETSISEVQTSESEEGIIEIVQEATSKASDWYENKTIPLFGGITVATLISTLITIATTIFKMRGDKSNKTIIANQDVKILELKSEVAALKEENAKYRKYTEEMMESFKVTLIETSATMTQVANFANTTCDLVVAQNQEIKKVELMKDSIDVSSELIAKSLALSDVAVKSGIAKDAQKLVNNLKEVKKDGGSN